MTTLVVSMGKGMAELWCDKVGSKWPDWAAEICLRQGKKLTTAITLALKNWNGVLQSCSPVNVNM